MQSKALFSKNRPRIALATLNCVAIGGYAALWNVVFLRYILNLLESSAAWHQVLIALGTMISISLCYYTFNNYYKTIYREKHSLELEREVSDAIYTKVGAMSYDALVSNKFYHLYTRVKDAPKFMNRVLDGIADALGNGIVALVLAVILFMIDPMMLALAIPSLIITSLIGRRVAKHEYAAAHELTMTDRGKEYVKRMIYTPNAAKEFRLFNVVNLIKKIFRENYAKSQSIIKKRFKIITVDRVLSEVITLLFTLIAPLIYILYSITERSEMTIGDFSAAIMAISMLSNRVIAVMSGIGAIQTNKALLVDFDNFLTFENESEKTVEFEAKRQMERLNRIEFKNVSFSYPGAQQQTLKDISFGIERGKRIALVGKNGSGKSTIIKLIMGLYQGYSGKILINDHEIGEYDLTQYYNKLGVVFQDFKLFATSLRENILSGISDTDESTETLDAVINKIGLDKLIAKLPNGIDTQLYNELKKDGINLSGGEMQRVALARACIKNAEFIIFDEPASALDPMAEEQLYSDMLERFSGETILFVSHRLATVRNADCIYVVDDGQIVEMGTHEALMNAGGLYHELFIMQAGKYNEVQL